MPRKPKDLTAVFIAERRGARAGRKSNKLGRPVSTTTVRYHERMLHLAELVAKHRDKVPVKSTLPKRGTNDARDAITAALSEAKGKGLSVSHEQVRRAWNLLGKAFRRRER